MRGYAIIGVPIDSVGRCGGTEGAPAALRQLGLIAALGADDRGDLDVKVRGEERDPETGILAGPDVLATTRTLRAAVAEAIAGGLRPFLAGGCCALLPGALAGARDALGGPLGLVNLDGHQDLYDGETSPTGEAADMPVSVALGRAPRAWVEAAGGPSASPARTVLLGYRDAAESVEYGMTQPSQVSPAIAPIPVETLRAEGPAVAADLALATVGGDPWWLHLDVDVLDELVFPATDYLMPGGLEWEELRAVLAPLLAAPGLAGVSLACFNPEKDPDLTCGRALVDTIGGARTEGLDGGA